MHFFSSLLDQNGYVFSTSPVAFAKNKMIKNRAFQPECTVSRVLDSCFTVIPEQKGTNVLNNNKI